MTLEIVELDATGTHALRRSVLRNGDPAASVVFDEDAWPGTIHLGVTDGDDLRAVPKRGMEYTAKGQRPVSGQCPGVAVR